MMCVFYILLIAVMIFWSENSKMPVVCADVLRLDYSSACYRVVILCKSNLCPLIELFYEELI